MARNDEIEYTIERLDEDSAKPLKVPFDIEHDKFIILSDVHKGDRQKKSDDFEHSEAICFCVLDYYLKIILNWFWLEILSRAGSVITIR